MEIVEWSFVEFISVDKALVLQFKITWFEKIDRRHNKKEDKLSKAICREEILGIWLEPLAKKSIDGEVIDV